MNSDRTEADRPDRALAPFFDAAKAEAPEPPGGLMSRILTDAAREMPAPPVPALRVRLWHRLADALGGWPAAVGLATVAAVGVWLGYNPPPVLEGLAVPLSLGLSPSDMLVSFDISGLEG